MKNYIILFLIICSQTIYAQNCGDFANYPQGEEKGKAVLLQFKSALEEQSFEVALGIWEHLYTYAPADGRLIYSDAEIMYTNLIEQEEDYEIKRNYQESIIELYQRELACICTTQQDSGKVLEILAYTMSSIAYEDIHQNLAVYQKAIEINKNCTSAYILAYYAEHLTYMYASDMITKDVVSNAYKQLETIKNANINKSEYTEMWKYVEEHYEPFDIIDSFECSYWEQKFGSAYMEAVNIKDTIVLQEMLDVLISRGCNDSDFAIKIRNSLNATAIKE